MYSLQTSSPFTLKGRTLRQTIPRHFTCSTDGVNKSRSLREIHPSSHSRLLTGVIALQNFCKSSGIYWLLSGSLHNLAMRRVL